MGITSGGLNLENTFFDALLAPGGVSPRKTH